MAAPHEVDLARLGEGRRVLLSRSGPVRRRRLERAIGVVYLPPNEREAHYISADLQRQFDAVVFAARTQAVTPLMPRMAPSPDMPAAAPGSVG
ncbi:MAG: erythromycin esterase family protein [Phenylobacterium sp.]|uniref:erythromycin esterase family protein n=1 Tax=Phenylobacterium sp. TaxID=1871053 RepID=UPI00273577F8|nr:erythromycin esterase family protein [Phenylobacterium sp.]MDP3173690.1 erythromycin esterase family protein [Phenylobacterium sp.]